MWFAKYCIYRHLNLYVLAAFEDLLKELCRLSGTSLSPHSHHNNEGDIWTPQAEQTAHELSLGLDQWVNIYPLKYNTTHLLFLSC